MDIGIPGTGRSLPVWLKRPSPGLRYGIAIALAALAQAVRLPLDPPTFMRLITYIPFMMLAAALGGLGPGLVNTALCTLECIYFATARIDTFRVDPRHRPGIAALALTGVVASFMFERIRRSESRQRAAYLELAAVQRSAPVMLLVVDHALRVRKANDLAAGFAAQSPSGMLGVGPGCPESPIREVVSDTLRSGRPHSGIETWVPVSVDGGRQTRCLQVSTVPMQVGGDAATALICAQDITERKQTQEDLRRQRDLLQRQAGLIDLSHDAIIVQDPNRVITAWNEGAHEIYGWTAAEAAGKVTDELFQTGATSTALNEKLGRDGRWDGELGHSRRDGTRLIVDSRQVLLRDPDGNAAAILEINRDITKRKHAEEEVQRLTAELERRVRDRTAQLEAANKELESFAYSVSHDLRAPLRGIDGWSLALVEDYGAQLSADAQRCLETVRSEAQRMGRLIDDLLRLSRVTRAPIERARLDLSALARSIAGNLLEIQAGRRIEIDIQPELMAWGDASLLEVALTNLLNNAAKFTGKQPQGRIEVGQTESCPAAFYVRDNGAGFDMAYAHTLFAPFQRLHRTSEFPGTGVGLATVQRIVNRHGGQVWAEAQVGRGATFYFTLGVKDG